jgi:hypothetical protein
MAPNPAAASNPFLGWGAVEAHRLNRSPVTAFGALAAAQVPVQPGSRYAAALARRSDALANEPGLVQERVYGSLPAVSHVVSGARSEALASASASFARERAAAPEARTFH